MRLPREPLLQRRAMGISSLPFLLCRRRLRDAQSPGAAEDDRGSERVGVGQILVLVFETERQLFCGHEKRGLASSEERLTVIG